MPTRDRTVFFYMTRSAPYEKSKCLGSGGSMVARLKLKEIDGRAPQGVKTTAVSAPAKRYGSTISGQPMSLDWPYTSIAGNVLPVDTNHFSKESGQ
jgi:hypothetical protein